jgi:hypothetical protein
MEMQAVVQVVANYLQQTTVPANVFVVLDMWVLVSKRDQIDACLQVFYID